MRLEWSRFALEDRDQIFDYIEQDNPRAAVAVDDRIREQAELLVKLPESGRPGRVKGTRELVIVRTPYIVTYRIQNRTVRVLRVLHSAQHWPEELPED